MRTTSITAKPTKKHFAQADGKIYCAPFGGSARSVLCIDPEEHTVSCFGSVSRDDRKWLGALFADNGRVYFAPFSAEAILCVVPQKWHQFQIKTAKRKQQLCPDDSAHPRPERGRGESSKDSA